MASEERWCHYQAIGIDEPASRITILGYADAGGGNVRHLLIHCIFSPTRAGHGFTLSGVLHLDVSDSIATWFELCTFLGSVHHLITIS